LKAMGRNPGTPWKSQNKLITINNEKDYISDRGDEVWNVLEQRGIRNVILTGVHLNMCVLGRPFGLRQMARNGKHVVLMRDMTDTMYNPKRWPFVTHHHATALVVSHVERFVCPTMTSDQIVGGEPFQLKVVDTASSDPSPAVASSANEYSRRWVNMSVPGSWGERSNGLLDGYGGAGWYRCVIRIPEDWLKSELRLELANATKLEAWINGRPLPAGLSSMTIPRDAVEADDANLLVVHIPGVQHQFQAAPVLTSGNRKLKLAGRWQFRTGDRESFANMPLPAKFGGSTDMVFTPGDPLFVTRPVTRVGAFTAGIEGPACDRTGNLYAVNFERQGTIGRITPGVSRIGEVFVELPPGSIGNGIRFDRDGSMYVADYAKHNILKINPNTRAATVHAHNSEMHQPNDLAIASDGTLYASDPNWKNGTGQLWRIDRDGTTTRLAKDMGTTNGIEVSPDNQTLYVNESQQKNIWAFTIDADKSLSNKRLLKKFDDHGFDGMRCDVAGNLYVTRYGKGTVVKLSPAGKILREISLPGKRPSNICFGGPDGCTAYVTEVEFTRILSFRVDQPGLGWSRIVREQN
jgi:sugar lactone lactonase YvrE